MSEKLEMSVTIFKQCEKLKLLVFLSNTEEILAIEDVIRECLAFLLDK